MERIHLMKHDYKVVLTTRLLTASQWQISSSPRISCRGAAAVVLILALVEEQYESQEAY